MDLTATIRHWLHAQEHVAGAVGGLIGRFVLAGCQLGWDRSGTHPDRADIGMPPWLPQDIENEAAARLFVALANGWPTDPLNPTPKHLEWVRDQAVYLHWPERECGWHWLLPMPENFDLAHQLDMAENLYDSLPGDIQAHISVVREDNIPLDIVLDRKDGETLVTAESNAGTDGVKTVTLRSPEPMRVCVMEAVDQLVESVGGDAPVAFN